MRPPARDLLHRVAARQLQAMERRGTLGLLVWPGAARDEGRVAAEEPQSVAAAERGIGHREAYTGSQVGHLRRDRYVVV